MVVHPISYLWRLSTSLAENTTWSKPQLLQMRMWSGYCHMVSLRANKG